jgi:hypothetical protein
MDLTDSSLLFNPDAYNKDFFDETIGNEKYGTDYTKTVAFEDAVKKKVTKYGKFSRMTVALPKDRD